MYNVYVLDERKEEIESGEGVKWRKIVGKEKERKMRMGEWKRSEKERGEERGETRTGMRRGEDGKEKRRKARKRKEK